MGYRLWISWLDPFGVFVAIHGLKGPPQSPKSLAVIMGWTNQRSCACQSIMIDGSYVIKLLRPRLRPGPRVVRLPQGRSHVGLAECTCTREKNKDSMVNI